VEVMEDNERGFVPIDYLEKIAPTTVLQSTSVSSASPIAPPPDSGPSSKPAAYQAKPFSAAPASLAAPAPPAANLVAPNALGNQTKPQVQSEKKAIFASVEPAPPPPSSGPVSDTSAAPPSASAQKAMGAANIFMKAAQKSAGPAATEAASVSSPPPPRTTFGPANLSASSATTTPLVFPPAAAPATSTPVVSKTNSFSKLKTAAKTVQNMVHVTSAVSAPRVPSLAAAVEREDFDELVKRNDEYFARLLSSQVSFFYAIRTVTCFIFNCRQTRFLPSLIW
jgi:hypothetical protein